MGFSFGSVKTEPRCRHQAEHTTLASVATLIASVALGAGWFLLVDSSPPDVSLLQIATSEVVSLGSLILFRLACLAIAGWTLWQVYFDRKGLEMRSIDTTITLRGLGRWTTFTVWCFSLLLAYFSLATVCSTAVLVGRGDVLPAGVVLATLILFEVSYPMSLLVTAIVTFVLFPLARRHNYPTDRMFRWRPQVMHNGNTIMMQLAMLLAPPPVILAHLSYVLLFGCCYAVFSWLWF